MSDTIRFPQVPLVDKDGMIALAWREWLQNPQILTLVLQTALGVGSGGTGLVSGTSGGVVGFTAADTMACSALLAAHALIVGGGVGATPVSLPAATDGQALVGQTGANPAWKTISGDGSLSAAGALTVTKTGGSAFAPSATTDTTNASNISSGSLPLARLALAHNDIYVGSAGGNPAAVAVSGDATIADTGALTVTKTNGVAFAPAATTAGLSVTITTAKLTVGGANGSMTFTDGVLTAQTAAT